MEESPLFYIPMAVIFWSFAILVVMAVLHVSWLLLESLVDKLRYWKRKYR